MKIEGLGPAIADTQAAEQIEIQTKWLTFHIFTVVIIFQLEQI